MMRDPWEAVLEDVKDVTDNVGKGSGTDAAEIVANSSMESAKTIAKGTAIGGGILAAAFGLYAWFFRAPVKRGKR